jgi:hypothetical protein
MTMTCATCRHFKPDPEPIAYPTSGNGWCSAPRLACKAPGRTRDTNWCDKHAEGK